MSNTRAAFHERNDLEMKFVLGILGLLAVSDTAYFVVAAGHVNVGAMIVLTAGVVVGAWRLAHYAMFEPIRRLVVMARAVGSGDFSKRLGFPNHDEIGSLAYAMDTMCDQLEAAQAASEAHILALDQLRHSDRVATLGRMASSVAHELGNPLNVIELRAQLISAGDVDTMAQAQQSATVIVEQTRRMTRIIGEILSFARMQPAKLTQLDLVSVVRQAIVLSDHTSKKHQTRIMLQPTPNGVEILGDSGKLLQIMVNLLVNGIQAMPQGGSVNVSLTDKSCTAEGDPEGVPRAYVCIDVTDHGVGIPAKLMPRVFEPFFSTKGAEGGTGLGLSVAQGIAREHDGWITVESELGRGTSFKVYLPKRDPQNEDSHAR